MPLDPKMSPPSDEVAIKLRKVVLAGMVDRVARYSTHFLRFTALFEHSWKLSRKSICE